MRFQILTSWAVFFCIAGCANTVSQNSDRIHMPSSWSLEISTDPGECSLIDGVYNNNGLGRIEEDSPLLEVGFDVALGRPVPSARTPETIAVTVENGNTLIFAFGSPQTTSFSQPSKCVDGWYIFERKRSDIYLGDGVDMDHSILNIAIGKSQDGSLIVHSVADEQYSSILVFKSKDSREGWFLFPRISK